VAHELIGANAAADRFVCQWDTGEVVERRITEKPTAWKPSASGIESVSLPESQRTAPSLSDTTAKHIAQLGLEVDRVFARRVDMEWVVVQNEVHIVQIRPLTALPEFFPHYLPRHTRDQQWLLAEQWHFPLRQIEGRLMPPLYHDLSIVEKNMRYHLVGPVEVPVQCRAGSTISARGNRESPARPGTLRLKSSNTVDSGHVVLSAGS
jgi:hypothetical protein